MSKNTEILVGAEFEFLEISDNGEVRNDGYLHARTFQSKVSSEHFSVTNDGARSQIELNYARPAYLGEVREFTQALAAAVATPTGPGRRISPIASAALFPELVDSRGRAVRDMRGFSPVPDPIYAEALESSFPNRKFDVIGNCGMHVHVSLGGSFELDEAVQFAAQMSRFQHFLAAISAGSPFENRQFTKLASARTTNWSSLRTTRYLEFRPGTTWKEYETQIKGHLTKVGMAPFLTAEHIGKERAADAQSHLGRAHLPVRPTHFGTVEVRVFDTPRTALEAEMFTILTGAIAGAIRRHNFDLPAFSSADQQALMNAAGAYGLRSPDGKIVNPLNKNGLAEPVNVVIKKIMKWVEPVLKEEGLWDDFEGRMNDYIFGVTKAKAIFDPLKRDLVFNQVRAWDSLALVHKTLHKLEIPGSEYSLKSLAQGNAQLSSLEARTLHVAAAEGFSKDPNLTKTRAEILQSTAVRIAELDRNAILRAEAAPSEPKSFGLMQSIGDGDFSVAV